MIDFIEAIKHQCKYSPFLGYCNPFPCKLNQYGWETYKLQGCKEMEIHWNPQRGDLRVKGSLPYFLQGHNFAFSNKDFVEGVGILQSLLGVGLWDAGLEAFEYGVIFPVDGKPSDYIRNHNALPKAHLYLNEKGKDKGCFRWWEDSAKVLKIYDAGKNIRMKQGLRAREVIEGAGFNPGKNYLKVEAHHKKPYLLNKGRDVVLEDLQSPEFQKVLSDNLIEYYHQLEPMRTLIQPTNKKDLSALDIVLSVLVEGMMSQGLPVEEVRKRLYSYINRQDALTRQDKDSRKATIRKAFGKLQESEESQWDLTHKIEEALAGEV